MTESSQTRTRSLWVCAVTLGLVIATQASQSQQNDSQPTLAQQFRAEVYRDRVAKVKKDIQAIETALTMFKLDNFMYPTREMGLKEA